MDADKTYLGLCLRAGGTRIPAAKYRLPQLRPVSPPESEQQPLVESYPNFVCQNKKPERFHVQVLVEEGGFARLRAGRSAALTRHRRVIHSRSPSNPSAQKKPSHLTV